MIGFNPLIFYIGSLISSLLIMMGLLFQISIKTKYKIYSVLFLSVGIGTMSYLIIFLLIFIIEQNFSLQWVV